METFRVSSTATPLDMVIYAPHWLECMPLDY
jgi:hypothetical protein